MAPARWQRLVPFGASRKERASSPSIPPVAPDASKTAKAVLDLSPQGLKIVAEGVDPVVDIVAVHGLNGHRDKTWTASNGVHWHRDLLPNDIPNARIFCWGYDANTHGDRVSCQYLYDHARSLVGDLCLKRRLTNTTTRPIIFVTHSLGGIIIKSALIHSDAARKNALEEHRSIKVSTYGIIFMGTPHQGGNGVQLGKLMVNIASVFVAADDRLMKHLERDSEWLQQQLGQYGPISGDFVTKFAYEGYATPTMLGHSIIVVPKASAVVPGMADAEPIVIHADHINMVKFASKDDNGYRTVSGHLRIMAQSAGEVISVRWETERRVNAARLNRKDNRGQDAGNETTKPKREPFSTVPFSRDPDFVDRPDILEWVREKCARPAARTALVGLGGVGKSQLAIEYSYQVRETSSQTSVFWVYGSTKPRFEEAYRGIADRLGLPGRYDPKVNVLQLVRDWLCDEANGRWMMVVDNVDNVEVFYPQPSCDQELTLPLAAYLPQSHNGSILITSRSRDAAAKLTGNYKDVKEVQTMDIQQALQLLRNKLEDSFDEADAEDLSNVLNYIPLAISQAAAYINRRGPHMTISSYLNEFRRNDWKKTNLVNKDAGDLRRDVNASHSITTTWQISFEQIRKERRSAADLLSLMSFFNPQGIPEWVLRNYARNAAEADDKECVDDRFNDDLDKLRVYSLVIATADSDTYEMHPLVQFCTRVWLSSVGDVEKWRQKFYILMSKEFPPEEFENWHKCQQLLPHIEPLFDYEPTDKGLVKKWARMLTNAAKYMRVKGDYTVAEDTIMKAINAAERALGREDPDTLTSMILLASVLQDQGKYEEAERMSRRAIEDCEKALGKEHHSTLAGVNILAVVLRDRGKYEEGEQMGRRALKGYEKVLGKEHPDTLASVHNLAYLLQHQNKYEEAEQMSRWALEGSEKALGEEHPDVLASVHNLAVILMSRGKYEEAEQMCRRAVEGNEKALGKEHPFTLMSVSSLAALYYRQKRYNTASELYERACDGCKRMLGPQHPTTIRCCDDYSQMVSEMDQSTR